MLAGDPRASAAAYHDLGPRQVGDLAFYVARVPRANASVLELGCGTGRITLPLSRHCGFLHGLDHSEAMLQRCRAKLAAARLPPTRVTVQLADITRCSLGRRFDLIVAPFRVLQNLATAPEVDGFFARIGEHLEDDGLAIVSAFHPNRPPGELLALWSRRQEEVEWEVRDGQDLVRCSVHRRAITDRPLVLHPDLVYQRFRDGVLIDEAVLSIAMRCYYPDELLQVVEGHGFAIEEAWGGYAGEAYGKGRELVVAMKRPR